MSATKRKHSPKATEFRHTNAMMFAKYSDNYMQLKLNRIFRKTLHKHEKFLCLTKHLSVQR
jgi:hypothetical protein